MTKRGWWRKCFWRNSPPPSVKSADWTWAGTVLLIVLAFLLLALLGCRTIRPRPAPPAPPVPILTEARQTLALRSSAAPPPPAIVATLLRWTVPPGNTSDTTTEVWASTNLTLWTIRTNVTGTNAVRIPHNGPREFYKTRSRFTFTITNAAGRIFTNDVFSEFTRH